MAMNPFLTNKKRVGTIGEVRKEPRGFFTEEGNKMSSKTIDDALIQKTIEFHGHWCPGLATGIRAAELALKEIGRATDEEIVAVVETDMCAVDAIQFLTGCTFGKGNLIYKDYGKNAFTFYRRRDGKSIRLVTRRIVNEEDGPTLNQLHRKMQEQGLTEDEERILRDLREKRTRRVMEADLSELFDIKKPTDPMPGEARLLPSLTCQSCGESVMESRTRRFKDQTLCIPCFKAQEKRY